MTEATRDLRLDRTRSALRQAFIELFFVQGYDAITVAAIAARAGVGRSTLYEHYRGKDELMFDTVRYPLEGLASAVDPAANASAIEATLQHFWAQRANARATRRESSRRAMVRVLVALIERRLNRLADGDVDKHPALAVFLAESQFAAISAWLAGDLIITAPDFARLLLASTRTVMAMFSTEAGAGDAEVTISGPVRSG